ncbi:hypothetical protein NEHOM01_1970 [Nematocida homosporus]|uniref:uncharacterized protein n=1 Tax=Nematocida homosporus TaxID=1912981 RepID=UPI00221F980C|nr:uncharacterized protein NEHOM01_1970 [Nematocida homosporus]KAI5187154.1 hypothetical protein NEHOM01_1970 [Nematocida homosporus]
MELNTANIDSRGYKQKDRPNLIFKSEDIENLKVYAIHKCFPPSADRYKLHNAINRFAKLYVQNDKLFCQTKEGEHLEIINGEDRERINDILAEAHGDQHIPSMEMARRIRSKYYGVDMSMPRAWVTMCLECRAVYSCRSSKKRYDELVKIVREPWFAISIFTISLADLLPGKGGVLLCIQDNYSKYVLHKVLPFFDIDKVCEFLDGWTRYFGFPEIIKILDPKVQTQVLHDYCYQRDIQIVYYKDDPDHFVFDITEQPRYLKRTILSKFQDKQPHELDEAIEEAIKFRNFGFYNEDTTVRSGRVSADVFFRRPVRTTKKGSGSQYWKTYKLPDLNLPSLLSLLPEYAPSKDEEAQRREENLRIAREFNITVPIPKSLLPRNRVPKRVMLAKLASMPVVKTPEEQEMEIAREQLRAQIAASKSAETEDSKCSTSSNQSTPEQLDEEESEPVVIKRTMDLKTDRELEQELRSDKDALNLAVLYNPEKPYHERTELRHPAMAANRDARRYSGSFVYIAPSSAFLTTEERQQGKRLVTTKSYDELLAECRGKMENPTRASLIGRGVHPDRFVLDEDLYWVVEPIGKTHSYLLYNARTREKVPVEKWRIFKVTRQVNQRYRHLARLMYKQFYLSSILGQEDKES